MADRLEPYSWKVDGVRLYRCFPSDIGRYVSYNDYAALEARVAELEKDAARYRWLKSCPNSYDSPASVTWNMGFDWAVVAGEELERSIDEAMSREA